MAPPLGRRRASGAPAVRLDAVFGDVDSNLAACDKVVTDAAGYGARIVVLPELFTSGVAFRLDIARRRSGAAQRRHGRDRYAGFGPAQHDT